MMCQALVVVSMGICRVDGDSLMEEIHHLMSLMTVKELLGIVVQDLSTVGTGEVTMMEHLLLILEHLGIVDASGCE